LRQNIPRKATPSPPRATSISFSAKFPPRTPRTTTPSSALCRTIRLRISRSNAPNLSHQKQIRRRPLHLRRRTKIQLSPDQNLSRTLHDCAQSVVGAQHAAPLQPQVLYLICITSRSFVSDKSSIFLVSACVTFSSSSSPRFFSSSLIFFSFSSFSIASFKSRRTLRSAVR
jgi:hypothetical protein